MPITLTKQSLDHLLHEIDILSAEEREYVKAVFGKYMSDGVSKREAEQAIHQLQINQRDGLSPEEVARIKETILEYFAH